MFNVSNIINIPKNLEIGYSIAMSTILFLSTIMFIYVLWVIFTKSPKEMKVYKFYLINYQIHLYICELLVGFLRPLFFIDNDGVFIDLAGFSLFNFSLPIFGCYLLCFGMFFLLDASILNLTLLVLYRYMQSTDNDFLRKYLDDMKNSIFVHLISYFLVFTVGILPIHIQAMQALIPNVAIQEKFNNQIVVGIKSLSLYSIIINIIFASVISSTFTYCVLSVLKTLRIHKTTLSAQTYKLFRGLINVILFDTALLVVFIGLPVNVIIATIIFFPQYSLLISTVIVIFIALTPLATEIILVLCIPPYFRATKSLFRKIFKRNSENQVTQINIRVVRASVQSTTLL